MLLANIPSLVRVVREACVPSCTTWPTPPPFSAPVAGQQREQPPYRTPKTLITALHSLPAVFSTIPFPTPLIFSNILPTDRLLSLLFLLPLSLALLYLVALNPLSHSLSANHYMQIPWLSLSANKSRGRAI